MTRCRAPNRFVLLLLSSMIAVACSLYAEAGMPVADVLRIATLDSARVTGVADRKGSIEKDKDADLILIDGNPFDDISAIRRAVLVMKGHTLYRPEDLYRAVGVKPFLPSIEM